MEGLAFGHVSCYREHIEEEYTCLEECYVEVDCTALALRLHDFDLPASKDLLDSVPCLCRSREAAPTQNGIQPSSSAEQSSTSSTALGAATPPQATRQGSEVSVRSSAPCGMVVKRDSWDTWNPHPCSKHTHADSVTHSLLLCSGSSMEWFPPSSWRYVTVRGCAAVKLTTRTTTRLL